MGCSPGALDSLWNTISGSLTQCQQSAIAAQESTSLQNASGLSIEDSNDALYTPSLYGDILSPTQADALASGDVNASIALSSQPTISASSCTGFDNLAQFSILSPNWFVCLGNVITTYAIWIVAGVVALILLYAYVSSR